MKHPERLLPGLFIAMLAGGFFACVPEEIEPEKKGPDTLHTEYGEIIISEDYVPIDWDKSGNEVLQIDVPNPEQAILTMKMEDKKLANQIQKGSLITVDVDTAIYLRKVVSSTINGTTVKAVTVQGTLEDVFSGSEFELCLGEEPDIPLAETDIEQEVITFPEETEEDEEEDIFYADIDNNNDDGASYAPWRRAGTQAHVKSTTRKYERPTKKLPRFYPKEIRYKDENGQWHRKSYEEFTRAGDDPTDLIPFNLSGSFDIQTDLEDESGFSVGVKGEASFETSVGFKMSTNYPDGGFIDKYKEGNVEIAPTFFFQPEFGYSASVYFSAEKKFDQETSPKFKPKLIHHIDGPKAAFVIGAVPVEIGISVDLYAEPEISLSATLATTFAGNCKANSPYELGIKYRQKGNKFSRIHNEKPVTWTNTFQNPTLSLEGKAECCLYVYPSFKVKLYEVIGPYLAFKPYVKASLAGGINTSTGLTWGMDFALGRKFSVGIMADVIGYELMNKEFKAVEIGSEYSLFEAPSELNAIDPGTIRKNQLYTISVDVTDDLFGKAIKGPIPVNVLFETASSSDKEIYDANASSGGDAHHRMVVATTDRRATVTWCPLSSNSCLTAAIYGSDGKMIDFCTFRPDNTPGGVQTVDLGTGVYWANVNVGYLDDIHQGDHVGWGDPTGEHQEQSFKAEYGKYIDDEAACLKFYGGSSPYSNISNTKYDYATAQWGGTWRMPTKKEWNKLIKNCKWEYDYIWKAYKVSNKNDKSKFIHLPADGCWIGAEYNSLDDIPETGEYWSATLSSAQPDRAWYVGMSRKTSKIYYSLGRTPRYYLQSVRAVSDKPVEGNNGSGGAR